jgi:hypothetical protein
MCLKLVLPQGVPQTGLLARVESVVAGSCLRSIVD